MFFKLGKSIDVKIWQLIEKVTGNCTVFAPRSHIVNEISKELATHVSGKLTCNWLIMLVTMATPISSHMRDQNSIFTAPSSETQGQIKGARESLNGRKNIYGTKKSKEQREEPLGTMSYQTSSKWSGALLAVLYFSSIFMPHFSARLDFPSSPLSTPGSPRMSPRMMKI